MNADFDMVATRVLSTYLPEVASKGTPGLSRALDLNPKLAPAWMNGKGKVLRVCWTARARRSEPSKERWTLTLGMSSRGTEKA